MERKGLNALRILLIALIIYMSGELIFTLYYYFNSTKESRELSIKVSELRTQNEQIKKEIQFANTQECIEKAARENLMLAKNGETVVYFKWDEDQKTQLAENQSKNFLQKTFDKLLKLFQK